MATVSRKSLLITICISLLLLAGLWIWKVLESNSIRNRAQEQILTVHEEHLRLLVKPFVWAVREELMQNNVKQVNSYLNDLVKEKNLQNISIADTKGIIISSTNKKNEGMPFSSISKNEYLSTDSTLIENTGDSILSMASPIMGFNSKLGTLFIRYSVPQNKLTGKNKD